MKAVVSKKTGEVLVFCEEQETVTLKDIQDILIIDASPCPCGKGWIIKRKREEDHEDY